MKKRGFTYIEVAIAFSIFALMLLFVMRMNSTTGNVMNRQREVSREMYLAQMIIEQYKTDYTTENFDNDLPSNDDTKDFTVHVTITEKPLYKISVKTLSTGSIINPTTSTREITVKVENKNTGTNVVLQDHLKNN